MTTRGKCLSGAAAIAALLTAWTGGQVLLGRHAVAVMHVRDLQWHARMRSLHPDARILPVQPVRMQWWTWQVLASAIAATAAVLVIVALVAGARRLWALLPACLPLTLALGRFEDGHSLGLWWGQPTNALRSWMFAGAAVDAVFLIAVAALALRAIPRRDATSPALPAVVRTVPVAIVATGWWLVGHALPDPTDRIWVGAMLLFITGSAITATLRLPWAVRVVVLLMLPFLDSELAQGMIGGWIDSRIYLQRAALALATAVYVAGVPALVRHVRTRRALALAAATR